MPEGALHLLLSHAVLPSSQPTRACLPREEKNIFNIGQDQEAGMYLFEIGVRCWKCWVIFLENEGCIFSEVNPLSGR